MYVLSYEIHTGCLRALPCHGLQPANLPHPHMRHKPSSYVSMCLSSLLSSLLFNHLSTHLTVFVQQVFDKLFSCSTRQAPEPRGGWRGGEAAAVFVLSLTFYCRSAFKLTWN